MSWVMELAWNGSNCKAEIHKLQFCQSVEFLIMLLWCRLSACMNIWYKYPPLILGCCWLLGPVEQRSCAIPSFALSCPPLPCVFPLCISYPTSPSSPTWSLPSCCHSSPKPTSYPMLGTKPAHCQTNDCLDRPACQLVCLLHHRNMDSVSHERFISLELLH